MVEYGYYYLREDGSLKKVLSVLLVVCLCCGMAAGCGSKEDSGETDKLKKEKPTQNEYGDIFNPGEYEKDGIKIKNIELQSNNEEITLRGVIENISQELKEFRFSYEVYNEFGEECSFFYGSKFTEFNYKLQPGESIEFDETVKNEDNSKGPYINYTIVDIYGAEQTAETKTVGGIENARTLGEYEIKAKAEEVLKGYNILSLDILHLTAGGFSVSAQIVSDLDGNTAIATCKEIGIKVAEFNPSYDIKVVSSQSQLIASYDSTGNEIIY